MQPFESQRDRVDGGWRPIVEAWLASAAGQGLLDFLCARRAAGATIYPGEPLRALALTPRASVRVVILGQDPYHGPGQAEGLAFSVPPGVRVPPSLRNILAELARERGQPAAPGGAAASGHLGGWARQGVLLLNATLSVEDGRPGAHAGKGWEALTDAVLRATAQDAGEKVYLLWGAHAWAREAAITAAAPGRHRLLRANHPSPLSARRGPIPFVGCGHFGLANAFLGPGRAIDWNSR